MREVGLEGSTRSALVACLQVLIPLGLQAVAAALQHEVTQRAVPRYRRTGGRPGVVRWGRQRGSVSFLDQKLPGPRPRAALLDIEPRLRRIKGHHHLPLLQRALAEEVQRMTHAPAAQVAA